jgi:hypothetical protein
MRLVLLRQKIYAFLHVLRAFMPHHLRGSVQGHIAAQWPGSAMTASERKGVIPHIGESFQYGSLVERSGVTNSHMNDFGS